jgi:hypothetical protein
MLLSLTPPPFTLSVARAIRCTCAAADILIDNVQERGKKG